MTDTEAALLAAISPVFPECAPHEYHGTALEYVTWNVYTLPQVYAERKPAAARYPTQVHYWLPHGKNPNPGKLALQQALFGVGFTWPVIEDASDSDGQHYVLECEYVNAGGAYGQT